MFITIVPNLYYENYKYAHYIVRMVCPITKLQYRKAFSCLLLGDVDARDYALTHLQSMNNRKLGGLPLHY